MQLPFLTKIKQAVEHLLLRKSGKFAKKIFYYLEADKKHSCRVSVTGKAVKAGDSLGTTFPCRSFFTAEEKYINILQEKLLLQCCKVFIFFLKCKVYYTKILFGRTFDRIIFYLFFVNISMVFSQVYFS